VQWSPLVRTRLPSFVHSILPVSHPHTLTQTHTHTVVQVLSTSSSLFSTSNLSSLLATGCAVTRAHFIRFKASLNTFITSHTAGWLAFRLVWLVSVPGRRVRVCRCRPRRRPTHSRAPQRWLSRADHRPASRGGEPVSAHSGDAAWGLLRWEWSRASVRVAALRLPRCLSPGGRVHTPAPKSQAQQTRRMLSHPLGKPN
jgi:hypothetical protein